MRSRPGSGEDSVRGAQKREIDSLFDGLPPGPRPLMAFRADERAPVDVTASFATLFECARAGLGLAAVGAVMCSRNESRHNPQARDRV